MSPLRLQLRVHFLLRHGIWPNPTLAGMSTASVIVSCIAFDELSVQVDLYCNPVLGISAVVHVVAVPGVVDIHIIVLVPVVRPVFGPGVKQADPIAIVLKAGVTAKDEHIEAEKAETMTR